MIENKQEIDEFASSMREAQELMMSISESLEEDDTEDDGGIPSTTNELTGQLFTLLLGMGELHLEEELGLNDFNALNKLREISDETTHDLSMISERVNELESEDKLDTNREYLEDAAVSHFLSENYILFFSLANAMLEKYSVMLLNETIIDEEYQESSKTAKLLERRLSQEEREQLLLRTGEIDEGAVGEMSRVRGIRNDLVHDIQYRQFSRDRVNKSDFERTLNIVQDIVHSSETTNIGPADEMK
ncbi:hypothetical protein [Natronoglomus mannanivorans]|uniref:Uncharacterized protein n=1 Tax=Natronoglomus mannanivorans TaxID=2979990 RepID=A0AAP3E4H6_9EURY|nr:hypothetical protein [Halobacteria archaeon AArc-xg1-1]